MKLHEIKLSIAKENEFKTWSDLMSYVFSKTNFDPEDWYDKVAKRYATEAIKADRGRTTHATTEKYKETGMTNTAANVKEIILNLPIELK